jgi:hypothetical protein
VFLCCFPSHFVFSSISIAKMTVFLCVCAFLSSRFDRGAGEYMLVLCDNIVFEGDNEKNAKVALKRSDKFSFVSVGGFLHSRICEFAYLHSSIEHLMNWDFLERMLVRAMCFQGRTIP